LPLAVDTRCDGALAKALDTFEAELLGFLVTNSLQYIDLFHAIDTSRNGAVTRAELHAFCTSRIWPDLPWRVTEHVFSAMEDPAQPNRVAFADFSQHVDQFRRIKAFEAAAALNSAANASSVSARARIASQQSRSAAAASSPSSSSSPFVRPSRARRGSQVRDSALSPPYLQRMALQNALSPPVHAGGVRRRGGSGDATFSLSPTTSEGHAAAAEALIANVDTAEWDAAYEAAYAIASEKSSAGSTWLERQRARLRRQRRWAAAAEACACAARLGEAAADERKAAASHAATLLGPARSNLELAVDGGFAALAELLKQEAFAAKGRLQECARADAAQRNAEEAAEADAGRVLAANVAAAQAEHAEAAAALKRPDASATASPAAVGPLRSSPKKRAPSASTENAWNRTEDAAAALFAAQRAMGAHAAAVKRAAEIRRPVLQLETVPLLSAEAAQLCAAVALDAVASRAFAAERATLLLHAAEGLNPGGHLAGKAMAAEQRRRAAADALWARLALDDQAADDSEGRSSSGVSDLLRPPPPQVAYLSLPQLRAATTRVFDATVGHAARTSFSVHTRWPEEGDPGYYEFQASALGQVLFNARGTVAEDFRAHAAHIVPFRAYLKGDRAAWGALLTALFNNWDETPAVYRAAAQEHLRFVVLDEATRAVGFQSLLREDWAALSKHPKARKAAEQGAAKRFKLSQPMRDAVGVDFFVSHNWSDENAPHRWAALCRLSDLFAARHGRLPRFWLDRFCIDQSQSADILLKTSMLPATLMSCKAVLVLQSPYYLGCSQPSALPSLWCVLEFFTLCCLAPHDDPTRNLVWVPLFDNVGPSNPGNNVPPKLDLLHGRVYCFSQEDKERLLAQLSACPGGLGEVQRAMSAVWPVHFRDAYAKWALLASAAGDGDGDRCASLLAAGASVDLPFEWSPTASVGTMVLVAATVLHEHWRWGRKKEFIARNGGGKDLLVTSEVLTNPRWKAVSASEHDAWFDPSLHHHMRREATPAGQRRTFEVDIDQPFGLLPPSWQRENLAQARGALQLVRDCPGRGLDEWAAAVHDQWLDRRRAEHNPPAAVESAVPAEPAAAHFRTQSISDSAAARAAARAAASTTPAAAAASQPTLPAWIVEQGLDAPFEQLPAAEQEKDRVVVRAALLLRTDAPPHVASLAKGPPHMSFGSAVAFSNRVLRRFSFEHEASPAPDALAGVDVFADDCERADEGGGEGGDEPLQFAQQPLQAAVSRFLRAKVAIHHPGGGGSSSGGFGEPPALLRAASSGSVSCEYAEGWDPGESCLCDPVVAILLDAGADPISAVVSAHTADTHAAIRCLVE
jgi:hypothetical protein